MTYSQLFDICITPDITVQEVVSTQGGTLRFRRSLTSRLLQDWNQLMSIVSTDFTHDHDQVAWKWGASGQFTVKSVYLFLNFCGIQKLHSLLL